MSGAKTSAFICPRLKSRGYKYFAPMGLLLHIFIAYFRMVLLVTDQCIGDPIEQFLRSGITEVFDSLSANAVVNRKSAANNRDVQIAGDVIGFAVANQDVGFIFGTPFVDQLIIPSVFH